MIVSVTIEHMLIISLLGWWYGSGWKRVGQILLEKLSVSEDFFSIGTLLVSIFAPFKQISASSGSSGTLQMKLQAWGDKQFSRIIGAIIRLTLILVGAVWLLIQTIVDIVILLAWPLLPFVPVAGFFLMSSGWTI